MARWIAAVVAALALSVAAPARADTIVFQRGGDLWLVRPDGSGVRRVTHGEHQYAWPSEADGGNLVATDAGGWIYRLTQAGAPIGAPLPTAATQTGDVPAEPPTHVRISPDGQRIAYDEVIDGDSTTLWTPAGATGLDFPGQALGQEELEAPSWIGDDRLLLSEDVAALDAGQDTYALFSVDGGDDSATGWFSDTRTDWASDFEAAASRDGRRLAVLADDAAVNGGQPTRAQLRLMTASAPGQPPQVACDLALPADPAVAQTSPTFSPDGTKLAWAESDGIHVATLGALSGCGLKEAVIAGAGASEPYWSPASDAGAPASGGRGPGTGRLTLRLASVRRLRSATLLRSGVRARVTCSAACALRIELRLDAASARRAHVGRVVALAAHRLARAGTITVHLRLRPVAERALRTLSGYRLALRASAPGASPVSRVLRPR